MRRILSFLMTAVFFLPVISNKLAAQDTLAEPKIITGVYHGESRPLKDIPPLTKEEFDALVIKGTTRQKSKSWVPKERNYPFAETALPKGEDPEWQKEMGSARNLMNTLLNFDGQTSPYKPSDVNGDVNETHYMQTINTVYAIYNKQGVLVAGPTNLNQLFSGVTGAENNDGDPIILWDEAAQRWMVAEFSIAGTNDYMLVAVSTTPDPTGTWHKYSFDVDDMPDYEKLGVWRDGYYMGTNTTGTSKKDIYVIERAQMLVGGTARMVGFDNPWRPNSGFHCVPPADNDGTLAPEGSPGIFITINDDAWGGLDQLWIYELAVNWSSPASSTFTRTQQINVPAFDSNFGSTWSNITQKGTTQKLDAVNQIIMHRPQYRNFGTYQTLLACHTVDVNNNDQAGVRWYELRRTGSGPWTVRQSGTYAPDIHSRWMASIAMTPSGKVGMSYSISSATLNPGIRYTGQSSAAYAAGNGIMDISEEVILEGTLSQTGINRWGDYFMLAIDPSDNETFWATAQYVGSGNSSKTRIATFKLGNAPLAVTLDPTSITSTTATLNGTVNPNTLATTYFFEWGETESYGNSTSIASAGSGSIPINVNANLSELIPGTPYHYRLVAANADGPSYGANKTFTPGGVLLTTIALSDITTSSAVSGGNISSDGGSAVLTRGVCWSTEPNPIPSGDNFTTDGSGTGVFTSNLTDLNANTMYYVRAYATSGNGTFYGNEVQFSTLCGIFGLPINESFTAASLPNCWSIIDNQGNGQVWQIGIMTGQTPIPALTGNYAFLNSDGYGSGNSQNTDLITPLLDLSSYSNVILGFKHFYKEWSGSSAKLSYSINGGSTWTLIQQWTTTTTSNPTVFSQNIAALAGQSQVKFKWNFTGAWGYFWALDDLQITGTFGGSFPTAFNFTGGGVYCQNAVPSGINATLSSSESGVSYQLLNNSVVTGSPQIGTGNALIWNNLTAGAYTVSATNGAGTVAMNGTVTVTEEPNQAVSVVVVAGQNPVCQGTNVTFTATPTNSGSAPIYQWLVNNLAVGTNAASYNYEPLNGDLIKVVMTSSLTCTSGSPATSNSVAITVNANLQSSVSITSTQTSVCQGTPVTYTAFPENGGSTPAYQWKVNGQNAGTNNSTFAYAPTDGDQIQVVMTSSLTCVTGNPASSNVISMIVSNTLSASVSITATQTSVCQGTSVTYNAFPENGGSTPAYQWKVNGQNAGTNNSTFAYTPVDGDQIQVVMTSSLTCVTGNPASSNVISMIVSNTLAASVNITALQNSVCQGTSVTFTAFPENGGSTPAYQWKVNGQNAGTNNSTFNYSPLNGDQVQVVMTSSLTCVTGNPATSNVISMIVSNNLAASVSITASQNSVCQGTSVTYTAFPENGGSSPVYQWKVNGQNAGTNNNTFAYTPGNSDLIQVVMTSSLTCVTGNPATSNTIEMVVNPSVLSLIANPMQGGTVSYTGTPQIGQIVVLDAVPANGWAFVNWTNSIGEVVSTNATFSLTFTGCNQVITANFNTLNTITGKLAFFNPYETPVPTPYSEGAFYTQLFDGLIPVGTSQQITTGIPYNFNGLETGKSYTMRVWEQTTDNLVGSTWTWNNYGGVTALDALVVSYMGIQNPVLSIFPWISPNGMEGYTPFFNQVADANNSSSITSLDALVLLYRSVNNPLTIPFPGGRHNFQIAGKKVNVIDEIVYPNAPDILFNPSGTYTATSDVSSVYYEAALPEIESETTIFHMYLVATGDVNVSYDVLNQTKLKSAISFEGVTTRKVNDELIIPVRLKQNTELAAASISMRYDPAILEVVDVIGIEIYTIDSKKGIVKIAWMDENGKPFNENDEFFALKIKILKDIKEGTSYLELLSGTEFSDKSAIVLNDVVLKANYIETSPVPVLDSKRELLHGIFPNPFRDLTTIQYTLPESGHVKVNVFNYLGQEVKLLINEHQLQGTHNLMLNNDDLRGAGTYIYQITFESKDQLIVERGTIMLAK